MAMKVSREGLIEIASHEGIVTSPYRDSVGVWTFGIGHTAGAGAPRPAQMRKGAIRPIAEIMDLFARDTAKFEKRVRAAFTVPLTQKQFDAAVSFDFNTGAIHKATWVKKFNAGDIAGARVSFMHWRKPAEIIPRRRKERDLFFSGKYSSGGYANVYQADVAGRVQWKAGKQLDVGKLMNSPVPPTETGSPLPGNPASEPTTPKVTEAGPLTQGDGFWGALLLLIAKFFTKGNRK